jgi:hypothetical protein
MIDDTTLDAGTLGSPGLHGVGFVILGWFGDESRAIGDNGIRLEGVGRREDRRPAGLLCLAIPNGMLGVFAMIYHF